MDQRFYLYEYLCSYQIPTPLYQTPETVNPISKEAKPVNVVVTVIFGMLLHALLCI